MDPRQELEQLRKVKRLRELEAKAAGTPPVDTPAAPAQEAIADDAPLMDRLSDPDRWKAALFNKGPRAQEMVAGTPPLAIPAGAAIAASGKIAQGLGDAGKVAEGGVAAPGALSKLAEFLQGGLGRRVAAQAGAGAATGALQEPAEGGSRAQNALTGAVIGGGLQGLGEGVGLAAKGINRIGRAMSTFNKPQADAYVANPQRVAQMSEMSPATLQDEAAGILRGSRNELRAAGAQDADKLRALLTGKSVEINPQTLMGASDAADSAIQSLKPQEAYQLPRNLKVDANELNNIKRQLQEAAEFKMSSANDPVAEARRSFAASKASEARKLIEGVDPGVGELNHAIQQRILLGKDLQKAQKRPLAGLTSESLDSRALLEKAQEWGAKGLTEFGDQFGAAKKMNPADIDDALSRFGMRKVGRGLLRGSAASEEAAEALTPILTQEAAKRLGK